MLENFKSSTTIDYDAWHDTPKDLIPKHKVSSLGGHVWGACTPMPY